MGSVHTKPRMIRKRYRSTSHSHRQSSSFISVIRGVLFALAASSLPFLIIHNISSLNVFLFEVLPTFWRCSCDLFTPKNLFVLLNVIILSIFAMSHLHSRHNDASGPSTLLPPAYDRFAQDTSEDSAVRRTSSEAFKLNDLKSADFQLLNEGGSYNEHTNDQPGNHGAHKDYDRNNQAFCTGSMVFKEMIVQTHLLQADGNKERLADRQTDARNTDPGFTDQSALADSEAGKASSFSSRVQQGNTVAPSFHDQVANIDTLLSDEDSIFARVQSRRPLPSARFTHKKAANKLSGLDRPLSPLKVSRPILKRGDTLDATWKAICESKRHSSPLHRHHSNHTSKAESLEVTKDAIGKASSSSYSSPTIQRSVHNGEKHLQANPIYRREPSMPQEELNAKVESFISRFNEQIRIQREKSLRDYMEMVGRGSS